MLRTSQYYLTIILVVLVCINGLTSDAYIVELDVVKASKRPIKVKPKFYNSVDGMNYAIVQLAIPYIKDENIKKKVARVYWCGTPTWGYLANHPMPSENDLRMEASLIEARYKQ